MSAFLYVIGFALFLVAFFIFLPTSFIKLLLQFGRNSPKDSLKRNLSFFILIKFLDVHGEFISYVTKFFPFSLLYKESLIHTDNKELKMFIYNLEEYLRSKKMPILVKSGDLTTPLATLYARPLGHYKNNKIEYLEKLEFELQKKYQTVYVREQKTGFRILITIPE